jgi:hypothetical protein
MGASKRKHKIMKNLNNQAFKYVWDELDDKLWNQVIGQICSQIAVNIGNQAIHQIRSQLWVQLSSKVSNQVSRLKLGEKVTIKSLD